MVESALKIGGSIIVPPLLGLEWIGLSQMVGVVVVLLLVRKRD